MTDLGLTATVLPDNADNKAIMWYSSKPEVATVSSDGTVTAQAAGSCNIICCTLDGSGVEALCELIIITPSTVLHEYVDLGLPSGTLWATCNVGADSMEEQGYFLRWGETEPTDEPYKFYDEATRTYTKYTKSGCELDPTDDAATVNWGGGWQTPSSNQMWELINNTSISSVTEVNGVYGRWFTGNNGNKIFLPASTGGTLQYWTRFSGRAGKGVSLTYGSSDYMPTVNVKAWNAEDIILVRPVRKQ